MKLHYTKPEMNTELLERADVLMVSEETDNRFESAGAYDMYSQSFSWEDIL